MFKFTAYSNKGREIAEEFLSMYELKYVTKYNPRGDYTVYFIYIDNEGFRKHIIEEFNKYVKIKEMEREMELNERSR